YDRVAVGSRRGLETLVVLLSVLKAGAAYVPIDQSHPRERLHYLLSDSAPVEVLTLSTLIERLKPLAMPLIEMDHCTESPST
ncbi:AMP-binding protein, partial [Pseudomonas syringae group genomosp. 7]|uniref:AMP-binding protein n=1 Tax=Pseudomonas syringae group genomosp. 7 TaxID=251699 RepID=UPI00377023C0